MVDEQQWRAVVARDRNCDGAFVFAVSTTGIYCRPSCSSRRAKRKNVQFFALPEAAEQAGFRACKRCRPQSLDCDDPAVARVREVCRLIDARQADGLEDGPPSLGELAGAVAVSPHHMQRSFKKIMGVSPAQYADARRLLHLKAALKNGVGVTGALYDAGYGAPSRLYEKAGGQLGMTPASFAKGGAGARIFYAITTSPLGRLFVAATEHGVCFLSLGDDDAALIAEAQSDFPKAEFERDDAVLADWVNAVVAYLDGKTPHPELPLDVQSTAFQRRVWEELMRIPSGVTTTYSELAERVMDNPQGRRAVARACATNPVSLIIPCHRVKRGDGGLGGYRWGLDRKRALIAHETKMMGGN